MVSAQDFEGAFLNHWDVACGIQREVTSLFVFVLQGVYFVENKLLAGNLAAGDQTARLVVEDGAVNGKIFWKLDLSGPAVGIATHNKIN